LFYILFKMEAIVGCVFFLHPIRVIFSWPLVKKNKKSQAPWFLYGCTLAAVCADSKGLFGWHCTVSLEALFGLHVHKIVRSNCLYLYSYYSGIYCLFFFFCNNYLVYVKVEGSNRQHYRYGHVDDGHAETK
jgi:cytochrome bd-type quinol oxidase subunit 1